MASWVRRASGETENGRQMAILTNFFHRLVSPIRARADMKRQSIVRELVQTERNYVDSLLICEEVYYKPLTERSRQSLL
jgi:hypothetical protein